MDTERHLSMYQPSSSNPPSTPQMRISGVSNVSPHIKMGAQGYSSGEDQDDISESKTNSGVQGPISQYNNIEPDHVTAPHYPHGNRSALQQPFEETEETDANTTVITTTSNRLLTPANTSVQEYFKASSPTRVRRGSVKYHLKLSIQFEVEHGEYMAVVGNIEELGNWKNFMKCKMQWTEGHVWVTEDLVTTQPFFLYKYVIMKDGKEQRWERGGNRIADLDVLTDKTSNDIPRSASMQSISSSMSSGRTRGHSPFGLMTPQKKVKNVEIADEWEHFKIKFSINDPIEEQLLNHGDYMRIIGSIPRLGSKNVGEMESTPPMRMSRTQRPVPWLFDKYGTSVRPWEIVISFQMGELELPNEIIYNYSKSNEPETSIVKEREPSRSMIIQQPEQYKGELGEQSSIQWKNQRRVWIVNGMIDKADANFLGGLYFDKIGDTRIFLGTYPLYEDDIRKMKDAGITGVLNLQTESDIEQRGIPWDRLQGFYKTRKIKCFRFMTTDTDEDELCAQLFVGAQHLNNMINVQNLTVYVHCTSGISRAPAVVLAYLCLFKRVKQWQNPSYVSSFVKQFHVNSNPNMRAVERVVQANLGFQKQQKDIFQEKKEIRRNESPEHHDGSGFFFPQLNESSSKSSEVSPQRLGLQKKRSAYKRQYTTHAYIPKRPITPNAEKLTKFSAKKEKSVVSGEPPKTKAMPIESYVPQQKIITENLAVKSVPPEPIKSYSKPEIQEYTPTPAQERESDFDPVQRTLNVKALPELDQKVIPQQIFKLKDENERLPSPDVAKLERERKLKLEQQRLEEEEHRRLQQEYEEAERKRIQEMEDEEAKIKTERLQAIERQQKETALQLQALLKDSEEVSVPVSPKIEEAHQSDSDSPKKHDITNSGDSRAKRAEYLRQKRQKEQEARKSQQATKEAEQRAQDLKDLETQRQKDLEIQRQREELQRQLREKQEEEQRMRQKQRELEDERRRKEFLQLQRQAEEEKMRLAQIAELNQKPSVQTFSIEEQSFAQDQEYVETVVQAQHHKQKRSNLRTSNAAQNRKQEDTLKRAKWSAKAAEQAAEEAHRQAEEERIRKERVLREQDEAYYREQEETRKKAEIHAIGKILVESLIRDQVKEFAIERQQQMEWEEQQREKEKLRQEKIVREQANWVRRQKLAEDKAERERLSQVSAETEEVNQRLQKISEENERRRRQIQAESEALRIQKEKNRSSFVSLQATHEAESQEMAERQARFKLEQLKRLQEEEHKLEMERQHKMEEEKQKRKMLLEQAEKETERVKQMQINNAKLELERLQKMRLEEEEKLLVIQKSYEEEERQRKAQLQVQEEIERQKQLKLAEIDSAEQMMRQKELASHKLLEAERQLRTRRQYEERKSPRGYHQSNRQSRDLSDFKMNEELNNPSTNAPSEYHTPALAQSDLPEQQIEQICNDIFSEAPIKFRPRRGNLLDAEILKLMQKNNVTIPVICVRAQQYLIGASKVNLDHQIRQTRYEKNNQIKVKIPGGGAESLQNYFQKNHRKSEKIIVESMIKSQQSLQKVVDSLVRGEKIKKTFKAQTNGASNHNNFVYNIERQQNDIFIHKQIGLKQGMTRNSQWGNSQHGSGTRLKIQDREGSVYSRQSEGETHLIINKSIQATIQAAAMRSKQSSPYRRESSPQTHRIQTNTSDQGSRMQHTLTGKKNQTFLPSSARRDTNSKNGMMGGQPVSEFAQLPQSLTKIPQSPGQTQKLHTINLSNLSPSRQYTQQSQANSARQQTFTTPLHAVRARNQAIPTYSKVLTPNKMHTLTKKNVKINLISDNGDDARSHNSRQSRRSSVSSSKRGGMFGRTTSGWQRQ